MKIYIFLDKKKIKWNKIANKSAVHFEVFKIKYFIEVFRFRKKKNVKKSQKIDYLIVLVLRNFGCKITFFFFFCSQNYNKICKVLKNTTAQKLK